MRLVNARRILWKSKPDSKKVGACFHPQCRQSFHKTTYRRTKGEAKVKPQNKCGPDQPSEPHRSWISLVCLPTARRGGTTALVRQRSRGSATFTSTKCRMRFVESLSAPYAAASGPTCSKSRKWRRPQCPGNQHALARISDFPWQFTLENCQLPPASPQSIVWQALRIPTFSVKPLWGTMFSGATEKLSAIVQNLWTRRLACGMLRKTASESRANPRSASQNLR